MAESAGLALGVVSLAIQICKGVIAYTDAVRTRGSELGRLDHKAKTLSQTLKILEQTAKQVASSINAQSQTTTAASLAVIGETIRSCEADLLSLDEFLVKYAGCSTSDPSFRDSCRDVFRNLKYGFHDKEVAEMERRLTNVNSILLLGLQNLELNLGVHNSGQLAAIETEQSQVSTRIGHQEQTLGTIKAETNQTLRQLDELSQSFQALLDPLRGITPFGLPAIERHIDLASSTIVAQTETQSMRVYDLVLSQQKSIMTEFAVLKGMVTAQSKTIDILAAGTDHMTESEQKLLAQQLSQHSPDCPWSSSPAARKRAEQSTTVRLSAFSTILGTALEISFGWRQGAGGFSISPRLSTHQIVDPDHSPSFKIMRYLGKMFGANIFSETKLSTQETERLFSLALQKLQQAFDRGEASPNDRTKQGKTLLHEYTPVNAQTTQLGSLRSFYGNLSGRLVFLQRKSPDLRGLSLDHNSTPLNWALLWHGDKDVHETKTLELLIPKSGEVDDGFPALSPDVLFATCETSVSYTSNLRRTLNFVSKRQDTAAEFIMQSCRQWRRRAVVADTQACWATSALATMFSLRCGMRPQFLQLGHETCRTCQDIYIAELAARRLQVKQMALQYLSPAQIREFDLDSPGQLDRHFGGVIEALRDIRVPISSELFTPSGRGRLATLWPAIMPEGIGCRQWATSLLRAGFRDFEAPYANGYTILRALIHGPKNDPKAGRILDAMNWIVDHGQKGTSVLYEIWGNVHSGKPGRDCGCVISRHKHTMQHATIGHMLAGSIKCDRAGVNAGMIAGDSSYGRTPFVYLLGDFVHSAACDIAPRSLAGLLEELIVASDDSWGACHYRAAFRFITFEALCMEHTCDYAPDDAWPDYAFVDSGQRSSARGQDVARAFERVVAVFDRLVQQESHISETPGKSKDQPTFAQCVDDSIGHDAQGKSANSCVAQPPRPWKIAVEVRKDWLDLWVKYAETALDDLSDESVNPCRVSWCDLPPARGNKTRRNNKLADVLNTPREHWIRQLEIL
ncbi:uncharacterized protein B0I36DRAFT_352937 [Microdochium trichocladiopsis]|uniref:Fungal N-terminal domain-containing protein n=1 Tax=Microdochium trichocladiopsis TaxID=1682393 RepID=A0A9P8XZY5_9PEZI|nr:uncharacterized protein B0I36DRAFT_352937 [Microdochium trichocladiopsis]KAH7024733.1 hypothetical protein B0I36DRAFT_352937 [Microdochium trichocladiopsis]